MPFTPFHFGPGAALHALAPKRISFLAFCAANVIMDIEPLYYMLTDAWPLHRFFHTYLGSSLIAASTVALYLSARALRKHVWLPNLFNWQALTLIPVIIGALLGSTSHIVLDSIMHSDIQPFAPFSQANALEHLISLDKLHLLCILAGLGGGLISLLRKA